MVFKSVSYRDVHAAARKWAELVNAVGATIRKIGGTTEYDLIYGEGTFVNRGSVEVNSGFLRASVTMPSGQLSEGTWRVTNGAQLILNGDAAITRNAATVVLTGANSLFNGLNSLTNNSGSLSLLGGRAFTTSAAFTNSGTMIVGSGSAFSTSGTFTNTGTLDVTGSFSAGGGLVAAGTLGGIGTFGSLTTLASGGTIAPGNSPGTLTFSAGLTLQAGSVLDFQLGTTSDRIVVSGGLLTGPTTGKVTLNLSNSGGFFAGAYTLINYATASGTASFDATDFSLGSTIPGFSYGLALSGNTLQLTASAIPEPSTYAAILGAVVLGLAWWRRGGRRAR